jgi:hypothetical protein
MIFYYDYLYNYYITGERRNAECMPFLSAPRAAKKNKKTKNEKKYKNKIKDKMQVPGRASY